MERAAKRMVRRKKLTKRRARDYLFVAILLAYPVLQFVITWSFVNIGSVFMAFQSTDIFGHSEFVGLENFRRVFDEIFHYALNTTGVAWLNNKSVILLNSLGYAVITIFISLPLSLISSYFLQKKMPLANLFRVIFFLPNVIPIVALVMAFNMPLNAKYGYLYTVLEAMGFKGSLYDYWPRSQIFIYIYCIWAGLGYNIVLLSGAIERIPKEIYESAQLDGAGYFTEFVKITVPLVWPTIVTLVVLGLTNVLTLYLQPYLLTDGTGNGNTYSIAMEIFMGTANFNPTEYSKLAAYGLLFSLIWAPIVLLIRNRMSKKYDGIDY